MKFAVLILVFLLTLLLILMAPPLLCFTTQLLILNFLLPLFSIPPSQQVFSLQIEKNPISFLFLNQKPLQTITQSLYFPSQVRFWNVESLIYLYNFVPLMTFSLIVSLASDQDSQLKQFYYLLSILGFLHWISKSSLCFRSHKNI